MHPALSVIVFTTLSGAGYGLLALLGILAPAGLLPDDRWFGAVALGLALVLITVGLMSSTLHLGRPERAWRALTQWRSSWLSREGVVALVTYVPAGVFGLGWVWRGDLIGPWAVAGPLAGVGAVATVVCTGMIYASLKPIRHWRHPLVVPVYLGFALMTGAAWLSAITLLFGYSVPWLAALIGAAVLAAWGLKLAYWRLVGRGTADSTPESATGLGALGRVRLLEAPHTSENYLLKEMAYRVARKHARKLRRLSVVVGGVCPLALTVIPTLVTGWLAAVAALVAALTAMAGVLIERWLFFAEARHTVTLYYGGDAA